MTGTSSSSANTVGSRVGDPALSLVIPLFDEEAGVRGVVRSLVGTLDEAGIAFQLVLVDNGSRDGTLGVIQEIARGDPRVEVLHLPSNGGYGGGILAGLRVSRAPVLGYLWGDDQVGHHVVPDLLRRITEQGADLAKARRVIRLDGRHRRALTRVYHTVFPLFFRLPSRDIHGCPKLFTREAFERIAPVSRDWFLDAEVMIRATELGLRISELDVVAYPRATGESHVRWGTVLEFGINLVRFKLIRPHG